MKPTEAAKLEASLKMPFPWGDFKGTVMQFVPSGALKWTAENWKNDRVATAADLVWNDREATGTHYEE